MKSNLSFLNLVESFRSAFKSMDSIGPKAEVFDLKVTGDAPVKIKTRIESLLAEPSYQEKMQKFMDIQTNILIHGAAHVSDPELIEHLLDNGYVVYNGVAVKGKK